ncbi:MAG: hypothetical protein JJT94_00745 [Bernardetiaceae bacterium]|nr:hypothetical protein [Bernardetiaceae bacterium]
MDFQFANEITKLSIPCPPQDYKPKDMEAFRWVFDAIEDKRNFSPRYFLIPKVDLEKVEKIEDTNKKDLKKCNLFALSFFISEQAAKDRFDYFLQISGKKIYKRFGTQIAKCNIKPQDGVNENPNKFGHFNHHPVKKHEYEARFIVVSKL